MREKNEMLAGIKHDAIVANIKRVKYSYSDNNINSGKKVYANTHQMYLNVYKHLKFYCVLITNALVDNN